MGISRFVILSLFLLFASSIFSGIPASCHPGAGGFQDLGKELPTKRLNTISTGGISIVAAQGPPEGGKLIYEGKVPVDGPEIQGLGRFPHGWLIGGEQTARRTAPPDTSNLGGVPGKDGRVPSLEADPSLPVMKLSINGTGEDHEIGLVVGQQLNVVMEGIRPWSVVYNHPGLNRASSTGHLINGTRVFYWVPTETGSYTVKMFPENGELSDVGEVKIRCVRKWIAVYNLRNRLSSGDAHSLFARFGIPFTVLVPSYPTCTWSVDEEATWEKALRALRYTDGTLRRYTGSGSSHKSPNDFIQFTPRKCGVFKLTLVCSKSNGRPQELEQIKVTVVEAGQSAA